MSAEHVEARREQILAGARRAFAQWGYDGATVPKLEEEIGLSHGAIFNYYDSKLDLFIALSEADHDRFHRLWDEDGFAALARHIASADPAWLAVYLELHRRLRTDPELRKRWRAEPMRPVPERDLFAHTILNGLVFARAAGATIEVEPIIALAEKALGE